MENVHVAVQVRKDPEQLVPGDAEGAEWLVEVEVVRRDGLDFRGPAVQGRRGEPFVYLTWGNVGGDGGFEMFRRAKLMLHRIDPAVVERASEVGRLAAAVDLTGPDGGPRCPRRPACHHLVDPRRSTL
jgi:Family of unknown function (DUF5990)